MSAVLAGAPEKICQDESCDWWTRRRRRSVEDEETCFDKLYMCIEFKGIINILSRIGGLQIDTKIDWGSGSRWTFAPLGYAIQ